MKIIILGGGAFGTAIAHQLAGNSSNEIMLLLRNEERAKELNELNTNAFYFANRKIDSKIHATTDLTVITHADAVLLAVPTKSILTVIRDIRPYLNAKTLLVNLAKGIYENGQTVVELLEEQLGHTNTVTLKGASFGTEMLDCSATLLTLGFQKRSQLDLIIEITRGTNIYLDYTTDVKGVELLSALKNIYAILLGNVDAKYNAANTRFMFLTKAVSEIKLILKNLGGREETIFLSCGIGDIALTALNDLSRNRTLGLLIGKGFYNSSFQDNSVVLEGIKTLKLIDAMLDHSLKKKLPLFTELAALLVRQDKAALDFDFDKLLRKSYTTVLTYGTFDLVHFGHLEILRRAKSLGDRLIVGLSTDEFNAGKGKICEMPFEKRKEFLESIDYVDLVIPENNWEQKRQDIANYHVDIFVMGDDWKGKFDFLNELCEVIYFPRTKGISTTVLKNIIKAG